MNDNNEVILELKTMVKALNSEAVELIDFDRLQDLLSELGTRIEAGNDAVRELEYLKSEYRVRIIGMLKANLSCRENDEDAELAVRLTDDTIDIKAPVLVGMYRKVAARFRNNFPASFNYLPGRNGVDSDWRNWREYKI